MTKEQEVIMKISELNFLLTGEAKEEYSETLKEVLNMLKENSAEIQQKNTELAEKTAEIEKKDKQIDLMAEKIHFLGSDYDDFCIDTVWNEDCDKDCKDCIKQYFERKATNNG